MEQTIEIIITWKDIRAQRDSLLLWAESQYNFDSPESLKKIWRDYKQSLRDVPQTYSNLQDLSLIVWPEIPDTAQRLNLSRLTR